MNTKSTEDRIKVVTTPEHQATDQSDEQLFQEYRQTGDSTVFAQLVDRYQRELYNYLRRFLNDASMAEDVFQATFLQVHVKQHLYQQGRRFRPWLYTVATNQAIDAQRRNKRHRRLSLDQSRSNSSEQVGTLLDLVAGDMVNPLQAADSSEQAQHVRDAVAKLPEKLRNAVNLVYFKGMKHRDAAEAMAVPVGTVKSRLHAAIARLGESWADTNQAKPS